MRRNMIKGGAYMLKSERPTHITLTADEQATEGERMPIRKAQTFVAIYAGPPYDIHMRPDFMHFWTKEFGFIAISHDNAEDFSSISTTGVH